MKRNFILGLLVVAGFLFLSSCKDDEPPIVGISFEVEEQEVFESDGTLQSLHPEIEGLDDPGVGRVIEVNLIFNRALAGNVVLKFDLDGTTRETSSSSELSDFQIMEEGVNMTIDDDEITILKGTTEAAFNIVVFEDLRFEYDKEGDFNADDVPYETIELTLESVVSGPAKLSTGVLQHTLKILEDDAVAALVWDSQDYLPEVEEDAEVDMDMIIWFEEVQWLAGANSGTDFEIFYIPAGLGDGDVGMSYTYYSGNSDDLDFEVAFFNTAGQIEGSKHTYPEDEPVIFNGNHKLINRNSEAQPKIAQTVTKDGINYVNFSALTVFEEGSRVKNRLPAKLDKTMLNGIPLRGNQFKSLKWNPRD